MPALPPPQPSIEIVVASQGLSKGLRQTSGPQLIVHPEVAIGRFFAGALVKNVTSATSDGEADLLAGLRRRLGGFDLTASVAYRHALDPARSSDPDAFEFYAAASRRFGPVAPRVSATWSPDDLGGSGHSLYVEAGATLGPFANASLSGSVGRRTRDIGADYNSANLGVSYAVFGHFTADLRYWHTDHAQLGAIYRDRVVASLRARF